MKSIAVWAIVTGSLTSGVVGGCIFSDGRGASTEFLCGILCDCLEPGDPGCINDCDLPATLPAECTSCITRHNNACTGLIDECADPCDMDPPPPSGATVAEACQIYCPCTDPNNAACPMQCETTLGSFAQECLDCIAALDTPACDLGSCQSVCQ